MLKREQQALSQQLGRTENNRALQLSYVIQSLRTREVSMDFQRSLAMATDTEARHSSRYCLSRA